MKSFFDGFYKWWCSKCGEEHGERSCGWNVSGQVMVCKKCRTKNLLVRTNCDDLTHAFGLQLKNEEREKELIRLQDIEEKFKAIKSQMCEDVFREIKSKISQKVKEVLDKEIEKNRKE